MKAFILLCCASVAGVLSAAAAPAKPNILMIVGDDMGYADVGFHGCKDIPTPNLDALAASGARFTQGYVSGPYCSPTRAGLFTGRYQTRFGHEFNPGAGGGLPVSETTIANRLKTAGYATGLVGKWHLGDTPEMRPPQRGFDEFFGFLGGAHDYFSKNGILRGNENVAEFDHTTDAFGREAAAFIEKHKGGSPWFLALTFNAVHTPMQATAERLKKMEAITDKTRRTYAAMMLAMDDAIGVVRAQLAATGQEENTLITFISDNGGPTMNGVTVNGSVNTPLRGSKRTTLEGGIRVPFVVCWPRKVKPGSVYENPVIQLDLTATALAAAGAETQANADGVDLIPFLSGEKTTRPHDALYWRFGQQNAIRMGDFKLVTYDTNVDTNAGDRKAGVTGPRLYNLKEDLGESNDLAASMPEKVAELKAKWDAWNHSNVSPLWGAKEKGEGEGTEPGKGGKGMKKKKKKEKNAKAEAE